MVAAKGNKYSKGKKNGQKLKTPELKKLAYDSYCKHIAEGRVKKSWYFEHPDLTLTWQTMETYIAKDPSSFNPLKKEVAFSKGYQRWENVVNESAEGQNKNANTATLQMLMRNKYGWDKEKDAHKDTNQPLVKTLAKLWRKSGSAE